MALQNLSYWEQSTFLEDIDFAIIGSGIVGLSAAISLREQFPKAKIVVLERGTFPSGASTKNAGFACFGSISELKEDIESLGLDRVMELVEKKWRGLALLKQRCGVENIDFKQFGGYELFLQTDESLAKDCEDYATFLNDELAKVLGEKTIFQKEREIGKFGFGNVQKMFFNRLEGQLNPAKMIQQLRYLVNQLKIPIINNIRVDEIVEEQSKVHLIVNDEHELFANKVLIATNGFSRRLLPELELRPARNQVIITQPIKNLPFKGTFHYDFGYYYFRNVGNRILLGGARNKAPIVETTTEFGLTATIQNTLEKFLAEIILPHSFPKIAYRWSGIMGVGNQKIPIVKKYSNHIVVAARLGGMGVAIGSLVGEEGARLL